MASIDAIVFSDSVIEVCQEYDFVIGIRVAIEDGVIVRIRIDLRDKTFVDIFHNSATKKTSFSLIEGRTRIFGADNSYVGWHVHPSESPEKHIPSASVTLGEFLSQIAEERFKE